MASDLNGTWLFRLAQEWYLTHPGEQIPHSVWDSEVQEALRLSGSTNPAHKERLNISAHDWRVIWVSPEMIPVIAAVTLGFSTEDLAKVVQHHNIGKIQLTRCSVIENFIDERTGIRPEDAYRCKLSGWMLVEEVTKAMCLDPKAVDELAKEVHEYGVSPNLKLACLLQDIPGLWPSTQLELHMESLYSGVIDKRRSPFQFIEVNTLATLEDIHDFSDDEVRRILERSGILRLGTTREMGFDNNFFFDLFEELVSPEYPDATYDDSGDLLELGEQNIRLITRFLNAIECPTLLTMINDKIRESLADFNSNNMKSGSSTLLNLQAVLDPVKYAGVFNDVVLKINLFPMSSMRMPRQRWEGPMYDIFYNEPSLLLSKLASQLLETAPAHFKTPHFMALKLILTFDRAQQDISSIDMTGLVCKLLEANEAYQSSHCCLTNGYPADYIKNRATEHLVAFLQYVERVVTDFDYSRIKDISNKSSLLLADSGFDPKKLPRLNKRDLGDLLSQRMGL
jgi:hypothetical protein